MVGLNANRSLAAGVLAAIGASVCCVVPLVLLGRGIGGAWIGNLTKFAPYRPVFIALAVACLAMAYWRLYRMPAACAPETPCAGSWTLGRQRAIFWLVAALVLGLLAVPSVVPLFY